MFFAPGRLGQFLVDTLEGRIIGDEEIKRQLAARKPYRQWLDNQLLDVSDMPAPKRVSETDFDTLIERQRAFGYTLEDIRVLLAPMAEKGQEPVGSMGVDIPLAAIEGANVAEIGRENKPRLPREGGPRRSERSGRSSVGRRARQQGSFLARTSVP